MKNENDYIVCLNEDGSVNHVNRNKIVKYCKTHIVEFLLIPMVDPRQYVLYQSPIKKFKELHLTFSAFMCSYDPESAIENGTEVPIYEHIHDYDVHCRDMVDFARFLQSMIILYSVPEVFTIHNDDFLDSFTIHIESAYVEYLQTDDKMECDRLKDASGTVRCAYNIPEFIDSLERCVCGNRTTQYMQHPDDLDNKTIVIDTDKATWTLEDVSVNDIDSILPGLTKDKYLFGVFSKYTNTMAFIPYQHIVTLALHDIPNISVCAISPVSYIGENGQYKLGESTLYNYLCENVGYGVPDSQLTVYNIIDGDFEDLFDVFYISSAVTNRIEIIMFTLNCERILDIYNMYNKIIHGTIIEYTVFQIAAIAYFGDKRIFESICEDLDMMSMHKRSVYDRFINELELLDRNELPERYINCSMEFLGQLPCELPF